jgi:hypothetical protein
MTTSYPPRSRNRGGGNSRPPPRLPTGYLQKGYLDDEGNPFHEVIVEWPKAIAEALSTLRPPMTTNQLRGAFFNEVRRIETKLGANRDFNVIRHEILKLMAFAADRRKKKKVPPLFEEFIKVNLTWATKGEKEFIKGFVTHFECLVCFYPDIKGQ